MMANSLATVGDDILIGGTTDFFFVAAVLLDVVRAMDRWSSDSFHRTLVLTKLPSGQNLPATSRK
jgi:hypothetical protein